MSLSIMPLWITIVMTCDVYKLSVDFADAPITCVIDAIFIERPLQFIFTEQNSACTACFWTTGALNHFFISLIY